MVLSEPVATPDECLQVGKYLSALDRDFRTGSWASDEATCMFTVLRLVASVCRCHHDVFLLPVATQSKDKVRLGSGTNRTEGGSCFGHFGARNVLGGRPRGESDFSGIWGD